MEKKKTKKDLQFITIYHLFYDKKFSQVIKRSTKFLEEFPYNQRVRYFKALSHRALKEYNEAIEELKYNILIEDNSLFYIESCLKLFFIYCNLNMYNDSYKLINKLENRIKDEQQLKNFEIAKIIIYKKLGIKKEVINYKYIQRQLNNYDSVEALKHIKKHKGKQVEKSYFYDKINIDYLYNSVRKNIKNIKKCDLDSALDVYFFSIGNIGFDFSYNNNCNILKVLALPGTSDIITMYPIVEDCGDSLVIDIDYDKLFSREKEKIKTLSQIDKFNSRYKR